MNEEAVLEILDASSPLKRKRLVQPIDNTFVLFQNDPSYHLIPEKCPIGYLPGTDPTHFEKAIVKGNGRPSGVFLI
jgi:hypothetical protein